MHEQYAHTETAEASDRSKLIQKHVFALCSEEVFDFSNEQMTTAKATRLKSQFCTEFQAVFELCTKIMVRLIQQMLRWCFYYYLLQDTTDNAQLVEATLETLLRFLHWIPVGYIFETNLLHSLVNKVCSLMMIDIVEEHPILCAVSAGARLSQCDSPVPRRGGCSATQCRSEAGARPIPRVLRKAYSTLSDCHTAAEQHDPRECGHCHRLQYWRG